MGGILFLSMIRSLYSAIPGQAIQPAIGRYLLAATIPDSATAVVLKKELLAYLKHFVGKVGRSIDSSGFTEASPSDIVRIADSKSYSPAVHFHFTCAPADLFGLLKEYL